MPYSAEYTLCLDIEETTEEENNCRNFKFIDEQVKTVPKLLKGFESRTDTYDRLILYLLTGKDDYNCMPNWQETAEDRVDVSKVFSYNDHENRMTASH